MTLRVPCRSSLPPPHYIRNRSHSTARPLKPCTTAPSRAWHRIWRLTATVLVIGTVGASHAQTVLDRTRVSGSVVDDTILYSIGGGRAVATGNAPRMRLGSIGARWNANLICGDMRLDATVRNQLNGITDGFRTIMGDVVQGATAAVASLPALIIQRADPALYNLITNGVLQARLDFDRSKLKCEAIADRLADRVEAQLGWDEIAEGLALRDAIGSHDAVSAIGAAENNRGNSGVPWINGDSAGGTDQEPIRLVADVTRAGYNLLNGRSVNDESPIDASACVNRLTCSTWQSPSAASDWAVRVIGEREHRTCDGCVKTQTIAGVGLTPLIQEEYDEKLRVLQGLLTGDLPMTVENLATTGSGSVQITRGVVEALRDEPDQDLFGKRLASEAALSSVIEKALLLQRTLMTGRKEPNVAANQLAQSAISHESELLQEEINNLRMELEVSRGLSGNSPLAILQRGAIRSDGSRGVLQRDSEPNRLNQIERRGVRRP